MASRVNVKFVVLLSVGLGLVFAGVAGALVWVKYRGGDRYARYAEEALKQGDIEKADKFYERAVGKEPANVAWLKAWRDTRAKKVPQTTTAFISDYQMYNAIVRELARVQKNNPEAHREYLQHLHERLSLFGGPRKEWESLVSETEFALRFFEPEKPWQIRRYRGLAVAQLLQMHADVEQPQREAAQEDLEAAVKGDPQDVAAAYALAVLHRVAADKDHADGKLDAEREQIAESNKIIDAMVAANPGHPAALTAKIFQEAVDVGRVVDASKTQQEQARQRIAAMDALKPRLHEVNAALQAADPKTITQDAISRWVIIAPAVDPKEGPDMAVSLLDRALTAAPTDPILLLQRAEFMRRKGDFEGAIAEYQKVIDLPRPTVSLQGAVIWSMRGKAIFSQANVAATMIPFAKDDAARAAAKERAKQYREALAKEVRADASELKLVDGKLLYVDGDWQGAQRLISEFVRTPGEVIEEVPDAYLLLAEIGVRLNQPGLAQECLEKVTAMRGETIPVLLMQAAIEQQLQHGTDAADLYRKVLGIDPDNKTAQEQLKIVQAVIGEAAPQMDDPVVQRLVQAQRLVKGDKEHAGDDQKAMALLEQSLEPTNYDLRVVSFLMQLKMAAGDRDGAMSVIQRGLAKRPDDQQLKTALERLQATATLEGSLKYIADSKASDLEKRLSERMVYLQFGKKEEALKATQDAAKIAPNDPRVLELQFNDALAANDLTTAAKLADAAAAVDADRAGGDTFRARLQMSQNNGRDAVVTLQRAVDRGNAPPLVYRMLGLVQLRLNRTEEGVSSLRRALQLSPTDVTTIKILMQELNRLDRVPDAVDVARQSEAYARRDPEFMNNWLAMESATGNAKFARERREQVLAQNPSDVTNKGALAELYLDDRLWEPARKLIDQLKASDPASLGVISLDARWHAEQGDLRKARQVFTDAIAALQAKPEAVPANAYLAFAQFMFRYGMSTEGLAALRQAEGSQDPKTMPITIALADRQAAMGMFAEAEASYRKALSAGVPDPDRQLRKRLIDMTLQQLRFSEAEKEFAAMGPDADADSDLMCQRARAARGLGDRARAVSILNQAIARFPNDPAPYLRRARLVMNDPSLVQDAMADLGTALKLRPGYWPALHTRYTLLLSQGKVPEGIQELKAAVDANPSMDRLRMELIEVMLATTPPMESEADAAADAGVKGREKNAAFVTMIADKFAAHKIFSKAAKYYKIAYQTADDDQSAAAYINCLLSMSPPSLTEAQGVLNKAGARVANAWPLLMTRAQFNKLAGNTSVVRSDIADAIALVSSQSAMMSWYGRFRQVYPEAPAAVEVIKTLNAKPPLDQWLNYLKARCMLDDPASVQEGLAQLQGMLAPNQAPELRLDICRVVGAAQINASRWNDALETCKVGLSIAPNDAMFNNNMAFIIADKQSKPAEALPYAEKAVEASPDNHAVLDTLAAVHWGMGSKDKAFATETQALRVARDDADKVNYLLKLARWSLDKGDRAGASVYLDAAGEILFDNPALSARMKPQFDQLQQEQQSKPT